MLLLLMLLLRSVLVQLLFETAMELYQTLLLVLELDVLFDGPLQLRLFRHAVAATDAGRRLPFVLLAPFLFACLLQVFHQLIAVLGHPLQLFLHGQVLFSHLDKHKHNI